MKTNIHPNKFVNRHIAPSNKDLEQMRAECGAESIDSLIDETIPVNIRLEKKLKLNPAVSEHQFIKELKKTASQNKVFNCPIVIGGGVGRSFVNHPP